MTGDFKPPPLLTNSYQLHHRKLTARHSATDNEKTEMESLVSYLENLS